ncbi:ATP-binding protein [Pseudocnuella soli]|uniref:ATP-binding protein n=1 Tax=Pseudocnuella soli TaxID=2502779 RepID=UPI001044CDF3|nr:ATP-binding protein [Pseudocnuella soli]
MQIINVVNKEVATIPNCASEPIHSPGAIQPFGVLLAVDANEVLTYCSSNTELLFTLSPAQVLGKSLLDIWPGAAEQMALLKLAQNGVQHAVVNLSGQQCDLFVYESGPYRILEFELQQPGTETDIDLFEQTQIFVNSIDRARSLRDLCQRIAEQTRAITGYDRVMIYRFDNEYNGQVYAESKRKDLEPYLDLHYPHTDIPPQARELYLRNLMRMIADVDYEPVPLLTVQAAEVQQPDLSDSVLRSVSPIHIQYLKNMEVGATLTVSIVLEGKLWGMIACHHQQPLHLSYARRKAALMQGHFLSSQIRVRQLAEEYEVSTVVEAHLQHLLNLVPQEGDFALKFKNFTSLMPAANATGVAVLHKGKIYEQGLVPPHDRLMQLFQWLAAHSAGLQFSTSHLMAHYADAEKISRQAAGILYNKLGDPLRDAIIWFREEVEQSINWAGDPFDAIQKHTVLNQLNPRSSFAIYRQQVRYTSREWRISELNAAARFAGALQNHFHLEYLRLEEASQRLLNERLQKANKELANINWITTHDLKEPLRKILIFASRVMDEENQTLSKLVLDSIERIQASAKRMQSLVEDITAYNIIEDRQANTDYTDLNTIVADVLHEYEEDLRRLQATWQVDNLPQLQVVPYQIRQLFVNLIGNAIKFAHPDRPFSVNIRCTRLASRMANQPLLRNGIPYYQITVEDNGIGFLPEEGEKIFDIFYRLHHRHTYEGNGIGLAICKRIVEQHGGTIMATGQAGAGAAFQIFLPAEN